MPESLFGKDTPQFGTAEYQGAPAPDVCKLCQQPIAGQYYRANAAMLCPGCAERLRQQLPQDSHAAFVRALVFGLGGFVAAFIAYSLIGMLLQGWTIGYLAVGVGWVVGKAMMAGSKGVGGRRYQIIAVLLTYAAVSMSAIPIGVSLALQDKKTQQSSKSVQPTPQSSEQPGTAEQTPGNPGAATKGKDQGTHPDQGHLLGTLALWGLASPFLELQGGIGGILMLIILFVGMQFAWKITRGVQVFVDGPFQTGSPTKA